MSRTMQATVSGPTLALEAAADRLALLKPRVVVMILLTAAVGFTMASPASGIDLPLLGRMVLGTALVASGTLALNQYLERGADARMRRTARRPLPEGRLQPIEALALGAVLAGTGLLWLTAAVDPVSAAVAALTVITYLFVYTPMKTRSALCTVAGAFPGALPPLMGWTAAGGRLAIGGLLLFGILFFWQLPHSLAIAHLYRDDYTRAGIKLLPTVDPGGGSTGRHAMVNALALLSVSLLPALVGMAGAAYFASALVAGCWLGWRAVALARTNDPRDARRLLLASYLYLPAVLLVMAADRR